MNKKFYVFLPVIMVPILSLACVFTVLKGSGNVITESRQAIGFDRVVLNGIGTLYITQGDEESLEIEAEDNILPKIDTSVRDGTLWIEFKERNWSDIVRPTRPIKYFLSLKELTTIELSGAGRVISDNIETGYLEISSSGVGDIDIDSLNAKGLEVVLSGAGNCKIAGEVTNQSIEISGAGSYKADGLKSQVASVMVSGMGNIEVWVLDALDILISGAGTVKYYGNPNLTQEVSGAGSIRSMD